MGLCTISKHVDFFHSLPSCRVLLTPSHLPSTGSWVLVLQPWTGHEGTAGPRGAVSHPHQWHSLSPHLLLLRTANVSQVRQWWRGGCMRELECTLLCAIKTNTITCISHLFLFCHILQFATPSSFSTSSSHSPSPPPPISSPLQ